MKKSKVLDSVEYVDTRLIDESRDFKPAMKKKNFIKWSATAACLCLLAVGAFGLAGHFKNVNKNAADLPIARDENNGGGIYIPPIKLPENENGVEQDMMGMVVYKGKIYSQAENYYGGDAEKINAIIEDYLGYATGSIDEWSGQEEYSKEFASSISGELYSVKGYDTDFRICIKQNIADENGEERLFVEFLECLNGITLNTGKDLFEDRLNIGNKTKTIEYQSHSDWNMAKGNIKKAGLSPTLWQEFLNQIKDAEFINTWDVNISSNPKKSIYDTDKQAHIILTMDDGTVVRLRLIEGGYVGYDALGWYFVKIPGETFEAVFSACDG